jgi:hypothetical protein
MTELSSAAQAIMVAATNGNINVVNDPVYKQCIAAALRAAADQVAPSDADEPRNSLPMAIECQRIRAELLAIADELEGIKYGTYRCALKNNEL